MRAEPPAFETALHVLHGAGPVHIRYDGKPRLTHFVALEDSLVYGPSSFDPDVHAKIRAAFWRDFYRLAPRPDAARLSRRGLSAANPNHVVQQVLRRRAPAIIWISTAWDDRLFLWSVLSALSAVAARERPEVWLNEARAIHGRATFEELLPRSVLLKLRDLRTARALWSAFTAATPRRLENLRRKRSNAETVGLSYARLLPTITPRRSRTPIGLSQYDATLLSAFTAQEWMTPGQAIRMPTTFELIPEYGDVLLPARLAQWSLIPGVLESRRVEGKSSFNCVEYRLTDKGRRLVDDGLTSMNDAPELPVGGHVAYARRNAWGARFTSRGWSLERIG